MTVSLTASETLDGAAYSDSLDGGGTGVDIGQVSNASFTPLTDLSSNDGCQHVFLRHDGNNKITHLACFLQAYGVGTGFSYGGEDTASNDYDNLIALGDASGTSKNNADGLSGGVWMEKQWNVSMSSQFDVFTRPTNVKIFKSSQGASLATAIPISTEAMVYNNSGETAASAPVSGEVGPAGNTTLGDAVHLRFRLYVPTSYSGAGVCQWETVFTYAYTD